jgi:ParB-like nuclease domain
MGLLDLDTVRSRLRVVDQSYGGVHPVPVERIIGSLDRNTDFDRDFRPRLRGSQERLASLRAAFPEGGAPFPPIEVHELGGAYFVADGHHRVALARERGAEYIDAEVTRLVTNYEVPPDVDVCELIHTEQQRIFGEQSGLSEARPSARIEFSRPGGYPELLETVKSFGYDLARRLDRFPSRAEVAAEWYDTVYLPGVQALRAADLPARYSYKTDADLFLWVYQRRRSLRVVEASADFAAAAEDASRARVSRRFRREFLRERSHPLQAHRADQAE